MVSDSTSIVLYAVSGYATFTTVAVIISTVYIYMLRKSAICLVCKSQHSQGVKSLNRGSVNNNYETDCSLQLRNPPQRSRSAPVRPKILSEYDPDACASKGRETYIPNHQYERIPEFFHHQYETIERKMAGAVSAIFDDKSNSASDKATEEFLMNLSRTIENTISEWQKRLQSREKSENDGKRSEDEGTYVTYCPKAPEPSPRCFGSTDHLQFLAEEKGKKKDKDGPYLEAKSFRARSNCPEDLKQLLNGLNEHSSETYSSDDNRQQDMHTLQNHYKSPSNHFNTVNERMTSAPKKKCNN